MLTDLETCSDDTLLGAIQRRYAHVVFHAANASGTTAGTFTRTIRVKGDSKVCMALCQKAAESIREDAAKRLVVN